MIITVNGKESKKSFKDYCVEMPEDENEKIKLLNKAVFTEVDENTFYLAEQYCTVFSSDAEQFCEKYKLLLSEKL